MPKVKVECKECDNEVRLKWKGEGLRKYFNISDVHCPECGDKMGVKIIEGEEEVKSEDGKE